MELVTLKDKTFKVSIPSHEIGTAIERLGARLNQDLANSRPLFLAVLNGSFIFAADLLREVTVDCEISFVKVASYHGGTSSSGKVSELIGLNQSVEGRTVVIVEDIVDTGNTIERIVGILSEMGAAHIHVATLLYKPAAYTKDMPVEYVAIEVPNDFLVGYGLDYDELGRNLKDIYVLHEP